MSKKTLFLSVFLLAACGDAGSDDNADTADTTQGRPSLDPGRGEPVTDDNGPADGRGEDPGTDPGTDPSDPTEPTDPTDPAEPRDPTDPGPADVCTASTLDGAIGCQIEANDAYVDAFCDCFTDVGFEGDRGACEADQPQDNAFRPDRCAREALLTDEPAAIAHSLCYADAATELAACIAVCPETEALFEACFDTVGVEFSSCDAALPGPLVQALNACDTEEPPTGGEPPAGVDAALTGLRAQRSAYVAGYCGCYVGPEFADASSCRAAVENQWDPGLTPCEAEVFSANPDAALPFIQCISETFIIAESACTECPMPGNIEYELCADLSIDLNFCFMEAPPALQDGLLACPR